MSGWSIIPHYVNADKGWKWTDLSKAQRVLLLVPTHILLPGKEGGRWEEGVGGGSALSYEGAAPFGAGPGLWGRNREKKEVSKVSILIKKKKGRFSPHGLQVERKTKTNTSMHKSEKVELDDFVQYRSFEWFYFKAGFSTNFFHHPPGTVPKYNLSRPEINVDRSEV